MGAEGDGGSGKKLLTLARLALSFPEWNRTCEECERFRYGEDGRLKLDKVGLPMLRPVGAPTPCHKCPKVPFSGRQAGLDTPTLRAMAVEPTEQSRQAFEFYRECRAVGQFPDDPLVRWCASLIREAWDERDRRPLDELTTTLQTLVVKLKQW